MQVTGRGRQLLVQGQGCLNSYEVEEYTFFKKITSIGWENLAAFEKTREIWWQSSPLFNNVAILSWSPLWFPCWFTPTMSWMFSAAFQFNGSATEIYIWICLKSEASNWGQGGTMALQLKIGFIEMSQGQASSAWAEHLSLYGFLNLLLNVNPKCLCQSLWLIHYSHKLPIQHSGKTCRFGKLLYISNLKNAKKVYFL